MKVIAIIYDGSEIPGEVLHAMSDKMSSFVKQGSNVVVKKFNESDLVNLGIKDAVSVIVNDPENNPLEHASNYMTTRFGTFFSQPIPLVLAMSEVKNSTTEEATILKNAVSIIVENSTNPILKKKGLTPSVVKVIKEFNTSYHV